MESIRIVYNDGYIRYKNKKGDYHREDGPAIERPNGYKAWMLNGKYHREDGPTRILSNGDVEYWLNDEEYSKEDWEEEVIKLKLKRIKDL